jgi:hypothetical protein
LKIFLVFAYYLLRDSGIKQKPSYIRVSRTYSDVKDFPKTGKSHPVFVWTGTIAGGGSSVYTPVKDKQLMIVNPIIPAKE